MNEVGKKIVYSLGIAQVLAPIVIPSFLIMALVMKVKAVVARKSEAFKTHTHNGHLKCYGKTAELTCPDVKATKCNDAAKNCLKFVAVTFFCLIPVAGALIAHNIKSIS